MIGTIVRKKINNNNESESEFIETIEKVFVNTTEALGARRHITLTSEKNIVLMKDAKITFLNDSVILEGYVNTDSFKDNPSGSDKYHLEMWRFIPTL
jgi:hypothetical protein